MASPQLEDGYTKVSNEILDVFAASNLFSSNGRIFWFVVRNTYGFQTKSHKMTASFIANGTGLSERQVKRSLAELKRAHVINRDNSVTGIQKDWELWIKGGDNSVTVTSLVRRGDKFGKKGVTGMTPKKEREERNKKKEEICSIHGMHNCGSC